MGDNVPSERYMNSNVLDRFLQLEGVTSPVERVLFCNCDSGNSAICGGFVYSA